MNGEGDVRTVGRDDPTRSRIGVAILLAGESSVEARGRIEGDGAGMRLARVEGEDEGPETDRGVIRLLIIDGIWRVEV